MNITAADDDDDDGKLASVEAGGECGCEERDGRGGMDCGGCWKNGAKIVTDITATTTIATPIWTVRGLLRYLAVNVGTAAAVRWWIMFMWDG